MTPTQQIHDILNQLHSNLTPGQLSRLRSDLRKIADGPVKQQEITLAEIYRDYPEERPRIDVALFEPEYDAVITLALGGAPPARQADVVHLDRFRTVPISGSAP